MHASSLSRMAKMVQGLPVVAWPHALRFSIRVLLTPLVHWSDPWLQRLEESALMLVVKLALGVRLEMGYVG